MIVCAILLVPKEYRVFFMSFFTDIIQVKFDMGGAYQEKSQVKQPIYNI